MSGNEFYSSARTYVTSAQSSRHGASRHGSSHTFTVLGKKIARCRIVPFSRMRRRQNERTVLHCLRWPLRRSTDARDAVCHMTNARDGFLTQYAAPRRRGIYSSANGNMLGTVEWKDVQSARYCLVLTLHLPLARTRSLLATSPRCCHQPVARRTNICFQTFEIGRFKPALTNRRQERLYFAVGNNYFILLRCCRGTAFFWSCWSDFNACRSQSRCIVIIVVSISPDTTRLQKVVLCMRAKNRHYIKMMPG